MAQSLSSAFILGCNGVQGKAPVIVIRKEGESVAVCMEDIVAL